MLTKTTRRTCIAVVLLLVVIIVSYGAVKLYLAQQIKKAAKLSHDLESVTLGNSQASVVPMLKEYGGYQWSPTITQGQHNAPDYEYVLRVDPWRFPLPVDRSSMIDRVIQTISTKFTPGLRRAIGLRRWSMVGRIAVTQGHVTEVTATALVEGSTEWLGGVWNLSNEVPEYEIRRFVIQPQVSWPQSDRYLVGWINANFSKADGRGEAVEVWMTPSATQAEKESASRFRFNCFSSRSGCATACDFVPAATEYANSGTWVERRDACSIPRRNGYE